MKPNVTLKVGKVKLEKNRDYTLVYRNNLQIGKASVVIQGMGNFTGKKTISFKIVPQTPKIQKLKKNKKSFAITYSSGKMVHGYQMEVSTASSFAAKKTQKYILNGNRFEAYGLKKGTYYIRISNYSSWAYNAYNQNGKLTFTATYPSTSNTAKIKYITINMARGDSLSLGADLTGSGTVTWKSSKPSVAAVSSTGIVTAKSKVPPRSPRKSPCSSSRASG